MQNLSLFLFLVFLLFSFLAVKLIKCIRFKLQFVKQARSLGYKVYDHPWSWTGSRLFSEFKKQYQMYGDANYRYKRDWAQYDIIVSNILLSTSVQVINPQIIQEFYLKANQGFYMKADIGFAHLKRLIKTNNLLLSEGHNWKDRRKILSSVFNYDFIINKIPEIQQICKNALDRIQQNKKEGQQIKCDISQPLLDVFSTVILKCFFKGKAMTMIGTQKTIDFVNKLLNKIIGLGRSKEGLFLGVTFAKYGLTQKNREINEEIMQFRNVSQKIVLKRISEIKNQITQPQSKKSEDIIQALTKQSNKITNSQTSDQSQKLKSQQIIDIDSLISEFLTFFLAGSETTLSFTRMMIYRLSCNPDILKKVREEFEREVKTEDILIEQLKNLKYFQQVQKQVLRMDSSIGAIFLRRVQKDHFLGRLKIFKGMILNIRLRALHYKNQNFRDPLQFNPDRWQDQKQMNSYEYLPFSAGARNCIGKHLALLENKIFMIEFLRRYKNIAISKPVSEIKFNLTNLYCPQNVTTILKK